MRCLSAFSCAILQHPIYFRKGLLENSYFLSTGSYYTFLSQNCINKKFQVQRIVAYQPLRFSIFSQYIVYSSIQLISWCICCRPQYLLVNISACISLTRVQHLFTVLLGWYLYTMKCTSLNHVNSEFWQIYIYFYALNPYLEIINTPKSFLMFLPNHSPNFWIFHSFCLS